MILPTGSSTEEDDDQLDALQYFINQLASSGLSTKQSKVTEETYHNILRLAVELREVAATEWQRLAAFSPSTWSALL